jgi:hypothetical protein
LGDALTLALSANALWRTRKYDGQPLRVIDTLREKFVQAFKTGQFELGPTLGWP